MMVVRIETSGMVNLDRRTRYVAISLGWPQYD